MKKRILFLLVPLLLLSGCGGHDDASEPKTTISKSQRPWTDGMVFSGAMDSVPIHSALLDSFPEYFGLDPAKGLDVIVWQMAPSSYSFGLLEHSETQRDWISRELMALKGVSAEQMREILATYAVPEEEIYIIPWQNPISSYLPAYCVNYGGEDMDAKGEAYIAEIRGMLFG